MLPCMFPGEQLPRTLTTHTDPQTHTERHACSYTHPKTQELWLKGLREWESMWDGCEDQMCLWAVELDWVSLFLRVTGYTHTHTQVRHMAQKTQAAHSTLVCWMKAVLPHCVCPVLLRWLQHCNQAAVSWFSAMYRWYLVLLFQRGSFRAISIPFLLSRLAFLTLNSSPVSDLFC